MHRIEHDRIESGKLTVKRFGGDIHDMQVKCVCGGGSNSCNNGWMRRLENSAKPVLVPLMNGEAMRLSIEQQRIVAGWAALKAMVAEHDSVGHVTTSQAERDHLMATRLPPALGWAIWIGYFGRKHWPGHLGSNPFAYWPEPERAHLLGVATTDFNGQSSFQVVKKLFIQIVTAQVAAYPG
jgi:hypothetical protein